MKLITVMPSFMIALLTCSSAMLPNNSVAQGTEVARPRSLVDHTRTDRLTGDPLKTPANLMNCPNGQVYSGGTCVQMQTPNPNIADGRSWTSYFLGQGIGSPYTARINANGTVSIDVYHSETGLVTYTTNYPPIGFNIVKFDTGLFNSSSREKYYACLGPNSDAVRNGTVPTSWGYVTCPNF